MRSTRSCNRAVLESDLASGLPFRGNQGGVFIKYWLKLRPYKWYLLDAGLEADKDQRQ